MHTTGQLLTDNRYQKGYSPTDKQLTVKDIEPFVDNLPFSINPQFRFAVIGHMQHFGIDRVNQWARIAAGKNAPERYFMSILSKQRYKGGV